MTALRRKVHVVHETGRVVYDRLLDDGTEIIRFESGNGFVERRTMARRGYKIAEGWARAVRIARLLRRNQKAHHEGRVSFGTFARRQDRLWRLTASIEEAKDVAALGLLAKGQVPD